MSTENERWRWLDGGDDLQDAYAVRLQVFCGEQGYHPADELDNRDAESWHLVVEREGAPVATGRIYWKAPGVMGLGRIAVAQAHRGSGLGAKVVAAMCAKAAAMGAVRAELDAQCRVIPFYEKQGFAVCGEEHMDGHVPHRMMEKRLSPSL